MFSGVGGSSAGGAANGSSTASSLVVHGSGAAAATPGSSGATNKLQRYSDMAMAQADPAVARRLVEQGRVKALGDGLDAWPVEIPLATENICSRTLVDCFVPDSFPF